MIVKLSRPWRDNLFMDIVSLYDCFLQHPVICTDTRHIIPGSLFFALSGETFNGNAFALDALKQGCAYAITDDPSLPHHPQLLRCSNSLTALQQLASWHRKKINIPVIGLTGTNGKTTTKELLYAVLSRNFHCLATSGNLNNHIGVPLTLLRIHKQHQIAIIEMGANHPGEIDFLCQIAQPTAGLITNIGKAHLEGFGSEAGVLKTKTELYRFLQKNGGTVFVNADDQVLIREVEEFPTIITYGRGHDNFVCGLPGERGVFMSFSFAYNGKDTYVQTRLTGEYNFYNALCAVTVGCFYGILPEEIKSGIEEYQPDNNRSQIAMRGSNTWILDAYNANPSSMQLAIAHAGSLPYEKKIYILGDMRELGTFAQAEHKKILDSLRQSNAMVVLTGREFMQFQADYPYFFFLTAEETLHWLRTKKPENTLILVKGSRGVHLEKIQDAYKD